MESTNTSEDGRPETEPEDNADRRPADHEIDLAAPPVGGESRRPVPRFVAPVARLVVWIALTLWLTLDHRDRLRTHVPGDPGDAYLILSLLEWGGDRSLRLFTGFWDGPMFVGAANPMAYSDTFLPLALPYQLLEIATGSNVIAFNVLFVSGWVLCGEATYALGRRLVGNPWVSFAAAAAFTFSTIRLTGTNHFQLAWAGFIPLAILALSWFWDSPTPRRGVALAAIVVAQVLTSAYYGVILLVVIGGAMGLSAVLIMIHSRRPREVVGHAVFFAAALVPMLYVRHQYSVAAAGSSERPDYPAVFATRLGDFRAPARSSDFLRSIPLLGSESSLRSPENYAYVGAFVVIGLLLFVALLALRPRELTRRMAPRAATWLTVVTAGALGFGIAVGRGRLVGVENPVYDAARLLVPGVSDMQAIGRLVVFAQLAFVLLAALAVVYVVDAIDRRAVPPVLAVLLIAVVGFEGSMSQPMVAVIQPERGSVNEYLQSRPAGNAVLLPMAPLASGIIHPFTESPRMVLGAADALRTVNGYSGYSPADYETTVETMNRFPEPEALDAIERLGIRYVVIYTDGVDIPGSPVDDATAAAGFAFWPADVVERRVRDIPDGIVISRFAGRDGLVLEIRTAAKSGT